MLDLRDVLKAAPRLLGWHLVKDDLRARIVEVEAYRADDPACHAFGKAGMKNMAMFGPPGHAYVYFNYGVHWMLNVTAHAEGDPAAILIRAAVPLNGLDAMRLNRPKAQSDQGLLSGPGKLAAAFSISAEHNGKNLFDGSSLHLEAGPSVTNVITSARIGISVAKDLPWRFIDGDHLEWVSHPKGSWA